MFNKLRANVMCRFRNAVRSKNIARIQYILSNENVVEIVDSCGNTFLHFVAENGTVDTATQLLNIGLNIHSQNKYGKTPIFYSFQNSFQMVKILFNQETKLNSNLLSHALYFGTEEIVLFLLRNLTIDFKCPNNSLPNRISVKTKNLIEESDVLDKLQISENLIKFLLSNKEYLIASDKYYSLLIFFAAKIGSNDILQLILNDCHKYLTNKRINKNEIQPEALNIRNEKGETALHYAVSQQHVDAVKFLLEKGANPNSKSKIKFTPLHYAARLENQEICVILLDYGANVNPNEDGFDNPLHLVSGYLMGKIFHGFDELTINVFRRFKGNCTINQEIMKLFLTHGADPNKRGNNGMPIFIQFCKRRRIEEMKILLEFGANIRIADDDGNTALHHASTSIPIIDLLLKNGLEIDVKNKEENTPLMHHLQKEFNPNMKLVEYLLDHGSSITAVNKSGYSVFDIAINYDHIVSVLTLLEFGADKILKHNLDSKNTHITGTHCYGRFDHPKMYLYINNLKILISYIALKRENINDYFVCCLNPNNFSGFIIFNEIKLELETLKTRKILNKVGICYSYYDFLARDLTTAVRIIKNPIMKQQLSNVENFRDLRYYKLFIQHRFKWANDLEESLDEIVNFLLNFGKIRLPILVIEIILSYFTYRDFQCFGKILSEIKN
ncbi:ankyrin-1-like [Leptopilina boulardi]|uniref:ankyrin-1-like n=1 Tax=Leptopilina boulardi TaxID=63433 RepID=UPI0021F535EE|nr:ankyrin-1-like [Leptopilina boulardi]